LPQMQMHQYNTAIKFTACIAFASPF